MTTIGIAFIVIIKYIQGVKKVPGPPAVFRHTQFHLLVSSGRTIPDKLS
jgi:hypothetical protein